MARPLLAAIPLTILACGAAPAATPGAAPIATSTVEPASLPMATAQQPAHPIAADARRGRVVDVGCGWQHACALLDDGTVRCWGRGDSGEIGDGMGEHRSRPTPVIAAEGVTRGMVATRAPLTGVVGLGVGDQHACALLRTGSVRCWGNSQTGQLALARGGGWSPRTVPGVSDAVEVAAGKWFTCARIRDGSVRCWGGLSVGRRGRASSPSPAGSPVETVGGISNAVKLAFGEANACAVLADGGVACWTSSSFGEGAPKVAVREPGIEGAVDAWAAKDKGGCARKRTGEIACWGGLRAPQGSLAHGAWGDREHCVVDASGDATCRGRDAVRLAGVRKAAVGGTVSCAILVSGELRCWGSTEYGQVGEGSGRVRSTPARVIELGRADALWVGEGSCARETGGAIKCWGSDSDSILGFDPPPHYAAKPVAFDALRGVTQVAIASGHGCALRPDDGVLCWDKDTKGVPAPVAGVTGAREIAVAADRACVRLADGGVTCWGSESPPARVKGLADVAQIAAGDSATCARLTSGKVRCWGQTGYLGDGSRPSQQPVRTPTWVKGVTDATLLSVSASGTEACVVRQDRTLSCWGHEIYGEFGDWDKEQEYVDHPVPVASRGVTNVVGLAIGDGNTCVIVEGGTVQCFGGNQYGEVGDGTTEVRVRPQPVPAMADVVEIGAHGNVMCARRRDGSVWCWGRGDFGGVGDGSPNDRPQPFPVTFD